MISGVWMPPGGSFEEGAQENSKKLSRLYPFCEAILDHFGSQIQFLCILFVQIYMLIFGIAFGRPPQAFLRILGSFQGAFWGNFEHFFADAAKLKKCNSLKRNA